MALNLSSLGSLPISIVPTCYCQLFLEGIKDLIFYLKFNSKAEDDIWNDWCIYNACWQIIAGLFNVNDPDLYQY